MNIEILSIFQGLDFDRGIKAIVKASRKNTNPKNSANGGMKIWIALAVLIVAIMILAVYKRDPFPIIIIVLSCLIFAIAFSSGNVEQRLKQSLVNSFDQFYETSLSSKFTIRNEGVYYSDLGQNPNVKYSEFKSWSFVKGLTLTHGEMVFTFFNNTYLAANMQTLQPDQISEIVGYVAANCPHIKINKEY